MPAFVFCFSSGWFQFHPKNINHDDPTPNLRWKYNIAQTCPNQSFFDLVNLETRAVFEQSSRQRSDWQRILGEVVWAKVQAPGRKTDIKLCKSYLDYAGHIQCMTQLYHTVSVPVLSCVVCIIVIYVLQYEDLQGSTMALYKHFTNTSTQYAKGLQWTIQCRILV